MKNNVFTYPINKKYEALTTCKSLGNMAFQVTQDKESVFINRKELLKLLPFDDSHIVYTHQSHSDVIKKVTLNDLNKGKDSFESGVEADALYTEEKEIGLAIFHADCCPIFFVSEEKEICGVIHAGHIGTLKHITLKALSEVINKEKLNPSFIHLFIGPCRHKESYEINKEEEENIISKNGVIVEHHFDIVASNKIDAINAGIKKENIFDIDVDTVKNNDCYSAYLNNKEGRMISLIYIKN